MNYSTTMAMHILIFIIMLVYSVMAPLIIVFGVIYFVLALLAARYDIIFVSKQEWQGGGSFWPITFHMLIVGLLIFQGVMVGYLSILKFALVPLLLGAPLLTVLYWGWVHFYVYPPTEYGYVGQYYTPLQIPEEENKVEFQDQDQDQDQTDKENHEQDPCHADSQILELDLDSQDSQEQSSDRDIELDKCDASPDDDDDGLLLYVQPDLKPLANPIAALQLLENSPENQRRDVDDEQDQEEKEAEDDEEDEERTEMKRNSNTKREEKGKGQEDPHGGTTRFGSL